MGPTADDAGDPTPGLPARFRDPALDLSAFAELVLVHCPRCARHASIQRYPTPHPDAVASWSDRVFGARRLVCRTCGHVATWPHGRPEVRWHTDGRDPFFGLPLWLRASCCGSTLWADNGDQLRVLRRWIGATHRERGSSPPANVGARGDPWESETWLERLPGWVTSRKHRGEVIRTIDGLLRRAELDSAPRR